MNKVAMANTKELHVRRSSGRIPGYVLLLIALGGVLLLAFLGIFHAVTSTGKYLHEADLRRSQENLDSQIADIRSGRANSIFLYCSSGTDSLMEQLTNVPGIEKVTLHLTDVTDEGMRPLAALKKLKSLTVYGGHTSIGDQGFLFIKTISSLEELELINTRVTDQSLPGLKELPNLRSLALFRDERGHTFLTDAGLVDLKALKELRQLNISGGWASDAAVKELQKALPNCKISTKEDDLDM